MSPRVRMYSRRQCGLCDEAREVLLAVREEVPFEFEEVLVDGRDDLERAYGLRVPVVELEGEEAFELHVDAAEFRSLVDRPGVAPRARGARRRNRR